ncbi:MAG: VOC family protein [Ornithinimicrobium sp.]
MDVPVLEGVHHLKLPVSDVDRSVAWYGSRLGYTVALEFREDEELVGVGMVHPAGGPVLGLRRDPERAAAAAGFDYFAIGVPDEERIRALADRLTAMGETHAGVQEATIGWILPWLHDPDGHEVRFYTMTRLDGTRPPPDAVGGPFTAGSAP